MVGYFRHGSDKMRQKDVQSMLDGIPGLTVNWHAVRLGPGSRLASNTDYQAFLAASTKAEDISKLLSEYQPSIMSISLILR